ncbi:MAG TPA: SGNH/GDSL hydrolase family protein [Gemmatimonadaceae bacterium]|nr:SGNH/GDSL hydrolase family protein [Gemmatimonadaceae bacterium]
MQQHDASSLNEGGAPATLGAAELRTAWVIVACAAAVPLATRLAPGKILLIILPWVAGAVILAGRSRAERVVQALRDTLTPRLERLSLVVLAGLFLVGVHLITLLGTLMLVLPLCVAAMLLAQRQRAGGGGRWLVAGTLAAVVISALLFAAELVLRVPSVAWRVGGPSARELVNARYDQIWTENIFEIRSRYETVRKPPGVRRIVVVGDSYTFGALIPETDSIWTTRLERLLATRDTSGRIEVINIARNGYTTANQAEAMRRIGWQFDPDLVIVQFLANDALPSQSNFRHDDGRTIVPVRPLLPATFLEGAIRSSALLAFVRQNVRSMELLPAHLRYLGLYRDGDRGWTQLRHGLREIGDSARSRGVPVVFAIHPMLAPGEWTRDRYPLRDVHAKVAGVARAAGMRVLDVTQAFMAEGGDWKRWWAAPFDGHPNTEGHAIIADYTARFLDSLALPAAYAASP